MEELRNELVRYIKRKFSNLHNIANIAEDIVHDGFLLANNEDKINFGYLSTVCIRLAYREYKRQKRQEVDYVDLLIGEDDVIEQIIEREKASDVLASLDTLREIEKTILTLRYYEDCSFAQISIKTGIKLNTVLTTHYRALEKLRPRLSKLIDFNYTPVENTYLKGND